MGITELKFKKEIEIIITPQAQKIIHESKHSLDEFTSWAFLKRGISLGGGDAAHFLEAVYKSDEEKHEY